MTKRPDVTAALTALQPLPPAIRLVSIDPSQNRQRFYSLARQQTLWEEGVLVQRWGRLGTQGRSRIQFFADAPQVAAEMQRLVRRRLQHGYQVVPEAAGSAPVSASSA